MKDMSEYFKYVENKDQRWTGIGLTEKAEESTKVLYIAMVKLVFLKTKKMKMLLYILNGIC